jgi:anti-sigma factor ChrR (cupin superfamily)
MTRHDVLDDDARDQAALAAFDALPPAEVLPYAAHLAECALCRAEVAELRRVAGELAQVVPGVAPPERLWRRIEAAVGGVPSPTPPGGRLPERAATDALANNAPAHDPAPNGAAANGAEAGPRRRAAPGRETQTWKRWSNDQRGEAARPFDHVPADANAWEATAIDGIEARKLFVDAEHDRVTMLVRMRAGSAYPGHVHATAEECFVLEGDLHAGDTHLHQGDYQRAAAGSVHPMQRTDGGCVLLLVSSLHDTLLPD